MSQGQHLNCCVGRTLAVAGRNQLVAIGAPPRDPLIPEVLTLDEAADHLRVSVRQVQRLRQTGALPATRIGSRAVVRRVDLDAFIANLDATSRAAPQRGVRGCHG